MEYCVIVTRNAGNVTVFGPMDQKDVSVFISSYRNSLTPEECRNIISIRSARLISKKAA